jgi:Zn-dependent alcohol dehydrogenase
MFQTHLNEARDLFTVVRYDQPTEAYIVQGCLVAAGIPAVVADDQLNQIDSLLTPALGGVRIRVPEEFIQDANEVIAAFNRGEYALADNVDVGELKTELS